MYNLHIFPSLKNKKKFLLTAFFLASSLFIGCHDAVHEIKKELGIELTKEERQKLAAFFDILLLRERGIYVLHGSKPMTTVWIFLNSKEEDEKFYKSLNEKDKKWLLPMVTLNWDAWEAVKDKIHMTNYVLFRRKIKEQNIDEIIFANRQNVIVELIRHYQIFRDIVGYDFSVDKIIFELENPSSDFWEKVLINRISYGLLCGYGKINSCFFENWITNNKNKDQKIANFWTSTPFKLKENAWRFKIEKNQTYKTFPLPVFRSVDNDPIIKKYIKERKQIIKLYEKQIPLLVTLRKLTLPS